MTDNHATWIRNRGGILLFIEVTIAMIMMGSIAAWFLAFALQVPAAPIYLGALVILVFGALVFARIVPSHIGFTGSDLVLRGLVGGRNRIVDIQDIEHVRFLVSPRGVRKPLKKRLYTVELNLRYGAIARSICDGLVTERLMAVLPQSKSRLLVMTLGGAAIEEKPPTI